MPEKILKDGLACLLVLGMMVMSGCSPDGEEGFEEDYQKTSVMPSVIASGLNYPWGLEFVSSTDGDAVSNGSFIQNGDLIVTNRGREGNLSNTVVRINPQHGGIDLYSDPSRNDLYGEPAVDGPYDVTMGGPFVWIANDAGGLGSIAVTDPNPSKGPNGPTGTLGEPVDGPTGTGVFGSNDFGFIVLSVTPEENAEDVSQATDVRVTFSQPVNPNTVTKDTFKLRVDYSPLSPDPDDPEGSFEFSPDYTVVHFKYEGYLAEATRYEIFLDKDITDFHGAELDGDLASPGTDDFTSLFTTGSGNPRVVWVSPGNNASNVPIDTIIEVGFSEPVRESSVSSTAFNVYDMEGDDIDGEIYVHEDLLKARFVPDETLERNATYTVEVLPKVEDLAGNPLDQIPGGFPDPFESRFSTGAVDNNPPRVVSITPADGQQGVSSSVVVSVNFSEDIDPSSRIGSYFTLNGPGGTLGGQIDWPTDSNLEFTPSNALQEDAEYTITILDVLADSVGNNLDGDENGIPGGNFVSTFSTGYGRLYVTSSFPENNDAGVSTSTFVYVNFSKAVNPASVSTGSFYIRNENEPQTSIPAVVSVNPGSFGATLKPDAILDEDTVYIIVVTSDVTDPAGNPLDQEPGPALEPFTARFTTGGEDLDPPCVDSVSPEDGADNISTGTIISVQFTEPILPASVTASTFKLSGPSGAIGGTYQFDEGNTLVNMIPLDPLETSQTYFITITSGVTDASGNGLDGNCDGSTGPDFVSSFTTGTGGVVINEVVVDPQQDWNDSEGGDGFEFNNQPGSGSITTSDEWIEIYNSSSQVFDLTNWTLEMIDTTPEVHVIGSGGGGTEVLFPPTATLSNFTPGSYLIIGNPTGSNNNDIYIVLKNSVGAVVDDVEIGDDPEEDGDGDGAPEAGENGNADSLANEAVARVPNGFDSDDDQADWEKIAATIGSSNNVAAAAGPKMGTFKTELGLIGMSGIVDAGIAPDDPNPLSLLFFATHTKRNAVYGIDFDDGVYFVFSNDSPPRGLEYVPSRDGDGNPLTGRGFLYVLFPEEGNLARLKILPSGVIGDPNTVAIPEYNSSDAIVYMTMEFLSDPVGIAYSNEHDRLYIACRGNGYVLEMTREGILTEVFDTGLGSGYLGGIAIGDLGGGDYVFITSTGGERIDVADGPNESVLYFDPHP